MALANNTPVPQAPLELSPDDSEEAVNVNDVLSSDEKSFVDGFREREMELEADLEEFKQTVGNLDINLRMPHGVVMMDKKKARRVKEFTSGKSDSLLSKHLAMSFTDTRFVIISFDAENPVMLTCTDEPPVLSSLKQQGMDINEGFKICMPAPVPKAPSGSFYCFGCDAVLLNKSTVAGSITIPCYGMIDEEKDSQFVCAACFSIAREESAGEHHKLYRAKVVASEGDQKSTSASDGLTTFKSNAVVQRNKEPKKSLFNTFTGGVTSTITSAAYVTENALVSAAAATGHEKTLAMMQKQAMSVATGSTGTALLGGTRNLKSWLRLMHIDVDDDHGMGVFKLSGIEYVANARTSGGREEFSVSGLPMEELELLIYDEKGDARVWGMKFLNKEVKMSIAAALLKAKKDFRPPGPRIKAKKTMLSTMYDGAKTIAKDKVFSALEAAFETCFNTISKSPWLRIVSVGSLAEIKEFVDFVETSLRQREIPNEHYLAKRHKWALNLFGHNALHYACWFGRPIEILQYLTTVIKINVNDKGLFGTGVHQAIFKGNLVAIKYMIFISHARGKHAPRKSVLDETMKAGFALLDEWTASDLVNNMWQFIFLGLIKVSQDDLGKITDFLDNEIEALEDWRDAMLSMSKSMKVGPDGKTAEERAQDEANEKLNRLLQISTETQSTVRDISKKIDQLAEQFDATKGTLLRGILDASELTVPNCFVLLPSKIEPFSKAEAAYLSSIDFSLNASMDVVQQAEKDNGKIDGMMKSKIQGVKKLYDWMSKCTDMSCLTDGASVVGAAASLGRSITTDQTFWLYLVDEVTQQPIVPPASAESVYPLAIEKPAKFLTSLLSLMTLTVKAASVINAGASVARLFGVPVPSIPKAVSASISSLASKVKAGTNVDGDGLRVAIDVGAVKMEENKEKGSVTKVRGQALRDFEAMLKSKDPTRTFAGLRRVITKDGNVIFALEESIQANEEFFPGFKAQIQLEDEKRTIEIQLSNQSAAQHDLASLQQENAEEGDTKLQDQLSAAHEKIKELSSIENTTEVDRIPRTASGLPAKYGSSDLVGKSLIVEGFPTRGVVLRYERKKGMSGSSQHVIKFEGADSETPLTLLKIKNGGAVGSRYVILE